MIGIMNIHLHLFINFLTDIFHLELLLFMHEHYQIIDIIFVSGFVNI